jgi:hypothetical protein
VGSGWRSCVPKVEFERQGFKFGSAQVGGSTNPAYNPAAPPPAAARAGHRVSAIPGSLGSPSSGAFVDRKGSLALASQSGVTQGAWRLFKDVNGLSHTYPSEYLIPAGHLFSDEDLKAVANYRSTGTVRHTLCTIHYTTALQVQYIIHYAPYTLLPLYRYSTSYTMHHTLYYCSTGTVHHTLCTIHYTHTTARQVQYIIHYAPYTILRLYRYSTAYTILTIHYTHTTAPQRGCRR